jgi:polyisoprenyl-phosphate glycosyltransferase
MSNVLVVTPVYNDWSAFDTLLGEIDAQVPIFQANVDVIAVDDGSTISPPLLPDLALLRHIRVVDVVHLVCNLGNQRAIAIGIAHAQRARSYDLVVILDSDGEDRPLELASLLQAHRRYPERIVVALRTRRSEGINFKIFYSLYKNLFRILIGRKIDFGNFCLIPGQHVGRLAHMPELWNHLPATILRSKLPVERVETERGKRYSGVSSMNVIALIGHGLSAMAVFSDTLFVRVLAASCAIMTLGGVIAAVATGLRLFTGLAIPGWTTTVVGVATLLILQGLILTATATFATLSNRTNMLFVPAINGHSFISHISRLKE